MRFLYGLFYDAVPIASNGRVIAEICMGMYLEMVVA
jgi:hypothetical protein